MRLNAHRALLGRSGTSSGVAPVRALCGRLRGFLAGLALGLGFAVSNPLRCLGF